MGNYRQHIGFAGVLGVFYAWGAFVVYGIGWVYGSVAALLATLGGLLPDLDHPIGVELKGFTGILGVLAAVGVWQHLAASDPDLPFEVHLWAVVVAYMLVRHGLRRVLSRLMVHRGISHSIPTAAVWACLTYLYYPSHHHRIRLMMAAAVAIGVLSHLVLDEYCSVDLVGARVNRAFGSALKLWSPSPGPTLAVYALAIYLGWQVLRSWPGGPWLFKGLIPPPPELTGGG
jgi:membrane-bound metal-dependent hydrolase YbcI (DUF457 family)